MSGFNAKQTQTYGRTKYAIGLGRLRPTIGSATREYNYLAQTSQTPFCSLFDIGCSKPTPSPPQPPGPTVPSAPTSLSALPGNKTVEISFTAPSNGGSPITNYNYSLDNGTTWIPFSPPDTSSPLTITGLTNGTTYNIKLRAVNAIGNGTASSSVSVTPLVIKEFYSFGADLNATSLNYNQFAADTSGNIFVAGGFTTVRGVDSKNFAIYNENTDTWTTFGSTFTNGNINCVAYNSGYIYIGGTFTTVNGNTIKRIAKGYYDGVNYTWSQLAGGLSSGTVWKIEFDNSNNIYIGGTFNSALDNSAVDVANTLRIVKWNGTTNVWNSISPGSGFSDTIFTIYFNSRDNYLYAGGNFTTINGVSVGRLAKWDGSSWTSVYGASFDGSVNTMTFDSSNNMYVGGAFNLVTATPSVSASKIVKWNFSTSIWELLGSPILSSTVNNITYNSDTNQLYFGGSFVSATIPGELPSLYLFLQKFNCASLTYEQFYTNDSTQSAFGLSNSVTSIFISPYSKRCYFGGNFQSYNTIAPIYASKYNTTTNTISPVPNQIQNFQTFGIFNYDNQLLYFMTNESNSGNLLRLYNPTTEIWSSSGNLGSGPNSPITSLIKYNTDYYCGGNFTSISGVTASRIAKFDGSVWTQLGAGANSNVNQLTIDNTGIQMYIAGIFTQIGPISGQVQCRSGLAIYNLSTNTFTTFYNNGSTSGGSLFGCVFDSNNTPYAYGGFTTFDGVSITRIAKYTGGSPLWQSIGNINASVQSATIIGNYLYAGGNFTSINGDTTLRYIAKYDTVNNIWSSISSDVFNLSVSRLIDDPSGNIYAIGAFTKIGTLDCGKIAKWDGTSWSTPSNAGLFSAQTFNPSVYKNNALYIASNGLSAGILSNGITSYY